MPGVRDISCVVRSDRRRGGFGGGELWECKGEGEREWESERAGDIAQLCRWTKSSLDLQPDGERVERWGVGLESRLLLLLSSVVVCRHSHQNHADIRFSIDHLDSSTLVSVAPTTYTLSPQR